MSESTRRVRERIITAEIAKLERRLLLARAESARCPCGPFSSPAPRASAGGRGDLRLSA